MQLSPYLAFNGQCAEAFRFYEKCLGGKIEAMMTHDESPMAQQVPPEWHDRIMHARLIFDSQVLMGADPPPQYYQQPQGFSVSLNVKERSEAEGVFNALAEGGNVKMPFQKTFWSAGFGMLIDRFGTPWMVNCEQAG